MDTAPRRTDAAERYRQNVRLDHEHSFSRTNLRVCYHVIRLDYKRNPSRYQNGYQIGILELAHEMRQAGTGMLHSWLIMCARWVNAGNKLSDIRYHSVEAAARAVHKRSLPGKRRG